MKENQPALDRFLRRKQGRTWDSVPVPDVTIRDLSVGERVGENLPANQQLILELLSRHPRKAAPELVKIVPGGFV